MCSITGSADSWLTQNKKEPYATLFDLKVTQIHQTFIIWVYNMILTKTKIYKWTIVHTMVE